MTPPPARETQTSAPSQTAPEWVPRLLKTIIFSHLTQRQKIVLQTMIQTANWKDWRLVSKQYYLAERCGLSTATVCRALLELETLSLVEGVRTRDGHKLNTTWSLKLEAIRALPSARSNVPRPMGEPSRSGPIVAGTRAERPELDRPSRPLHHDSPLDPPSGARPALESERQRAPEPPRHRPPEPPRHDMPYPLAPGVWLYLSPEMLQLDLLQQLQALMAGLRPQPVATASTQPPRTFHRPETSPQTAATSMESGSTLKDTGSERNRPTNETGSKECDMCQSLRFQNEIATRGGPATLKFQNETHLASPDPVDLYAVVNSTSTSSSSSSLASQQIEIPHCEIAAAETSLTELATGCRPASQEPTSATGLSALAPQRSAPPRSRREVGGSSALDLPTRLYALPTADLDVAEPPERAPSKAKPALKGDVGPPAAAPPGGELPPHASPRTETESAPAPSSTNDAPEADAAPCPDFDPRGAWGGRAPNSLEMKLIESFRRIVMRWTGGDGETARWSVPPGLEQWFLDILRSDDVVGMNLPDVLIGWEGYLATRAARGHAFTTPTESFRQQLDYARRGMARSRHAAQSEAQGAGNGVRKPRPPEGAIARRGEERYQYMYTQLYPISISYQEYLALMGPNLGPDESLPTWEEFKSLALAEGNHPIP